MNTIIRLFKIGCSYIFPWLIAERSNGVSSFLEVWLLNGTYQLHTRNANYSFGNLHKVFKCVFDQHNVSQRKVEKVLILGFGTGSVAHILQQEYQLNCAITAVEIDPVVLELGHKYFNLSKYKNLNLVCADATVFMKENVEKYDLIVVDLFLDLDVPEVFTQIDFLLTLKNALAENGILFFNKIPYNTGAESETLKLEVALNQLFRTVVTEKMKLPNTGNWIFVCKS